MGRRGLVSSSNPPRPSVSLRTADGPLLVDFDEGTLKALCGEQDTVSNRALVKHFLGAWLAILSDSPLQQSHRKPRRLYVLFLKRIRTDGLLATIKRLSGLADQLMNSQELTGSIDLTNQWVEGFADTPVFKEYHEFYRTGDPTLMRYLLSFLLFGKKLKYDNEAWHTVAFRNWCKVEEKLQTVRFNDDNCLVVRAIVGYLISNVEYTELDPKFGPGKVAQRGITGDIQKVNALRFHPYLAAIARRLTNTSDFLTELFSKEEGYYPLVSRLKFVPKDISKSRSICMEPNSIMLVQQMLFQAYRRAFAEGPMSQFVDLSDQSINRDAALYGSFSGDVDTIDLSSASDSVSFDLIRRVFPKEHLYYLGLSRTSRVETPDGSVVRVKKFAPMGSALCFPIQCIIFTALTIYTAMCHSGWLDTHRARVMKGGALTFRLVEAFCLNKFSDGYGFIHPNQHKYQPLRVFGDDICVDSSLTHTLIKVLTDFGFSVNVDKSFKGNSAFRESCGGFYLRGFDVTPLRYTLRGCTSDIEPEFVASSIVLSNRAGDYAYFALKKYVMQYVLWRGGIKRPFLFSRDRDRTYAFYSESPVNDHLLILGQRFVLPKGKKIPRGNTSRELQRTEAFCYRFVWKDQVAPLAFEADRYDLYLYRRWWAKQRRGAIESPFSGSSHRVATGCRLRQGWIPV